MNKRGSRIKRLICKIRGHLIEATLTGGVETQNGKSKGIYDLECIRCEETNEAIPEERLKSVRGRIVDWGH